MGLFKSEDEKKMEKMQEMKKHWTEKTEYKLGVSFEEYQQIANEFNKLMIEIVGEDKIFQAHEAINGIFSDLSPKQKLFIHLYSIVVVKGT